MRSPIMLIGLCVASLCGAISPAPAQEPHKGHSAAELNQQFGDPDLDVEKYIERFESDSREIYTRRREIVEAIGLRPGMVVADIGSGTGLFAWPFAERVGPEGTVYAVEIAPAFLRYIGEQARKRGLEKVVKPVRSTQETTNLAAGSIDVAFVCATYHHFEQPARVLASIHRALRPGGRLVVIDFDLRDDSSDFVREHARSPKEVYFEEIRVAGFAPVGVERPPALKDNFFAVFRRTGSPAR
jgi:SAM-dependent methyltransferase